MIVVYILIAIGMVFMFIYDLESFIAFSIFVIIGLIFGGAFQGQCNTIREWRNLKNDR